MFRRLLLVLILLATVHAHAADAVSSAPSASARGPRVEITLRGSHAVYSCWLLAFDKPLLTLLMDGNITRQESIGNVERIRFLPPPLPAAKLLAKRGPPLNSAEAERLEDLLEKDKDEVLSEAETDEMLRLRIRAPIFPSDAPGDRLLRIPYADEVARHEFVKNRLDAFINELQVKTKFAENEAQAQEGLLMLGLTYRYKGYTFQKAREMLKQDASSIVDSVMRKKAVEFFEKIEPMRMPQQLFRNKK